MDLEKNIAMKRKEIQYPWSDFGAISKLKKE